MYPANVIAKIPYNKKKSGINPNSSFPSIIIVVYRFKFQYVWAIFKNKNQVEVSAFFVQVFGFRPIPVQITTFTGQVFGFHAFPVRVTYFFGQVFGFRAIPVQIS